MHADFTRVDVVCFAILSKKKNASRLRIINIKFMDGTSICVCVKYYITFTTELSF